jgi:hypothetical protein
LAGRLTRFGGRIGALPVGWRCSMLRTLSILLAVAAVVAFVGCGDDDDDDDDGGETVDVTLREFSVEASPGSASAGDVTFDTTNAGGEPHELVVIRTDLAPGELPTDADGAVDEGGEGIEVIGEIEEFEPGEESATFALDAGDYALICNVVEEEEGEVEAHYELGMFTAFTVD